MRKRKSEPQELEAKPRVPARERIIEVAGRCFYLAGINTSTIGLIAKQAKINSAYVLEVFGSHEDLVVGYLQRYASLQESVWKELKNEYPGGPEAQLRGWIELASKEAEHVHPQACPLTKAAIELAVQRSHLGHRIIRKHKTAQLARVAQLCREAGYREPDVLAKKLTMLVEGAWVTALTVSSEGPYEKLVEASEDLLSRHKSP